MSVWWYGINYPVRRQEKRTRHDNDFISHPMVPATVGSEGARLMRRQDNKVSERYAQGIIMMKINRIQEPKDV